MLTIAGVIALIGFLFTIPGRLLLMGILYIVSTGIPFIIMIMLMRGK